ncbi:MAG: cytochrome c oxidase assembly protein, partial [Mesorhizobium sp.]|nr:cytochrome c oxidase assembly protein [Mesorhizobium sp.]
MSNTTPSPRPNRNNTVVATLCVAFFVGMIGMAYAAVPFYRLFCQVTGYGGTTQRAEEQYAGKVLDRDITIRFDANASDMPWDFEPVARSVTLKIGATGRAYYRATNKLSTPTTGRATFNVVPELAGKGHGRWLMSEALTRAWRADVRRVTVNTCTLDHPAAL